MMKKLSDYYNNRVQKGFTLIELLVVLGILGILAAALLASINPVEQLKKAQDTSLKNVSSQFVGANVRYYSNKSYLPWAAAPAPACNGATTTLSGTQLSTIGACTQILITEGELKTSFLNSSNLGSVYVSNNGSDVIACFQPQSVSQQLDANTKYTQTGSAGANCKSAVGTATGANCYWCAQ